MFEFRGSPLHLPEKASYFSTASSLNSGYIAMVTGSDTRPSRTQQGRALFSFAMHGYVMQWCCTIVVFHFSIGTKLE